MMSVMDHSANHNNDNTNNNINDGDMRICDSSTDRRRSSAFSAIGDETLPFNLLEDVRLPNNGNGPNDTETERNIEIEIERQIRRKSKNIRELFANILNQNQIQNCSYVDDINNINPINNINNINPINTVNSVNSVNGNNMDITTNNGIVVTTNANGMNTDMPMSSSSFDVAVRVVNDDTPNNQNDILVVNNYNEYNDNNNDNNNNNCNSVRRKSALLQMKEMRRQSDDSVFGAFYPVNLTSGGNSTGENGNGNLNNPIINHQSVASSSPQPLQVGQAPTSASLLPSSVHPNNNEIAITNNDNDGTDDIIVTEPGPYDIVCGRNNGAFNYVGNRRFRVTIEMNFRRYVNSPTREDKTNVIKSIVTMLRDRVGARFLKKVPPGSQHHQRNGNGGTGGDYSSIDYNKNQYTIMTEKQCREKVGHALRDMVMAARKEYNARTA